MRIYEQNSEIILALHPLKTEAHYERLFEILQDTFNADLVDRNDAPYAIDSNFLVSGIPIRLSYDSSIGIEAAASERGRVVLAEFQSYLEELLK